MSRIDELVANAQRHTSDPRPARPALGIAVVACMDARLDVFALLGLVEGDAHVIRNAGGIITDDVIRSLIISQRMLGTAEIMLLHHTDCGMIRFSDADLGDQIEAETGVRPSFALGAFTDIEKSVRTSMARVQGSPFLASRVVRGFVYDVDEGTLREIA